MKLQTMIKLGVFLCFLLGWQMIADAGQITTYTIDDWRVDCPLPVKDMPEKKCIMSQTALEKKSGKLIYRISISFIKDQERPNIEVLLPLGVRLPDGLIVEIDPGIQFNLPYYSCVAQGCIVRTVLDAKLDDSMRRGYTGRFRLMNFNGKEVVLPISLTGFRKAMEKLESQKK